MADLLACHIFRRVSNRFHARSGDGSKRSAYHDLSVAAARALALHFHGGNAGTPADQITKRIANMTALLEGDAQPHSSPSTTVTDEQLEVMRTVFAGGSRQPSVKVIPPLNAELGGATHVPVGDVISHVVDDILVPSRDSMPMQSVLRQQYQVGGDVLGSLKGMDEELMLECVRVYLALRCVLNAPFQVVGEVHEPSLAVPSFSELLPPMPERVSVVSPVVLAVGRGDDGFAARAASGPLGGAPVLACTPDPVDVGVQLYKARLSSGYGPCTLVVVPDKRSEAAAAAAVSAELERMGWSPTTISVSSGDGAPGCIPDGAVVVDRSEGDDAALRALGMLARDGVSDRDQRVLVLLRSAYADVLSLGYPAVEGARRRLSGAWDCAAAASELDSAAFGEPSPDCGFREMVLCVREAVRGLRSAFRRGPEGL